MRKTSIKKLFNLIRMKGRIKQIKPDQITIIDNKKTKKLFEKLREATKNSQPFGV